MSNLDGYATVEIQFPERDVPQEDPFIRKATWLLAMFMYEDMRQTAGGPPWGELGWEKRVEWQKWTKDYVERMVEKDAESGLP
jgi:hypothetical protein